MAHDNSDNNINIVTVDRVHLMNDKQNQATADLWTKSISLD